MGLRVNTNTQSLVAQRNLSIQNSKQQASMEKLSSGSRINRAADDAAGLAISENMRGQIRSVKQGIRNANDAISLVQTAEGSMNEIANILVRFRELSIQSASDTVSDRERTFIQKEVQELALETDRIAQSTQFNGMNLLNGEGNVLEFQVGINNNPDLDRYKFNMNETNVTADKLGVANMSVATKADAQSNLQKVDDALLNLTESRSVLGALQNRIESNVRNMQIYEENLTTSKSRISDVDIASETAEMTKRNILSSAGTSVLSQANQNSLLALKLLG